MTLRTIIVEDEMILVITLEEMLRDLGHDVVGTACRLAEAAELISTTAFDVAILDVNLAGEMTFPLADVLTGSGKPFVFWTGYGEQLLDDRYSGHPILAKPCDEKELAIVLQRIEGFALSKQL
jgi:CheY-like chemotaxis protein